MRRFEQMAIHAGRASVGLICLPALPFNPPDERLHRPRSALGLREILHALRLRELGQALQRRRRGESIRVEQDRRISRHGAITCARTPELPPVARESGVRWQLLHLAGPQASATLYFQRMCDAEGSPLAMAGSRAPNYGEALEFGVIDVGELRRRRKGGLGLLELPIKSWTVRLWRQDE